MALRAFMQGMSLNWDQARERLTSYRGRMTVKICCKDTHGKTNEVVKDCGLLPIMIRVCSWTYFSIWNIHLSLLNSVCSL